MGGFANARQLADAQDAGKYLYASFRKQATQTTGAGVWFDLSMSPGRFLSGTVASIERSNFSKAGQIANRFQALSPIFAGLPNGHLSPSSWSMPRTGGAMSSVNSAALSIAATGLAVGGVTASGSASITFTVPAATGALIASGAGSASFAITANGAMTGTISGAGSASFAITTNTPLLGAIAGGGGSASFAFTANGSLLPLDDTPPARTAAASFAITASAIPSAIGHMIGSTEFGGELTQASIATAVWSASAVANNDTGTMGQKLNSAASAGDPWITALPGSYPAGSAGALLAALYSGLTPEQQAQLTAVAHRLRYPG